MNDGLFHFKRFSVAHSRSSMKVGVDAVLIGSWADCCGDTILDVGTGCGVIALIVAQRNPAAEVVAIDVDVDSIEEANNNFAQSDWHDRLTALLKSFDQIRMEGRHFDRIVSNPPYFDSGVTDFSTTRNVARHQGELSPEVLIDGANELLSDSGKLSMIVPSEFFEMLADRGKKRGLSLSKACFVKGNPRKASKRVMLEFERLDRGPVMTEYLTIYDDKGDYTPEYMALGKDFYLKF